MFVEKEMAQGKKTEDTILNNNRWHIGSSSRIKSL